MMSNERYNVTTNGGEILNLDGPLSREQANEMASEIEADAEFGEGYCRVVAIPTDR